MFLFINKVLLKYTNKNLPVGTSMSVFVKVFCQNFPLIPSN